MEAEMHHLLLKTGLVTGACALAFLGAPGPSVDAAPFVSDQVRSLVVPVVDQEDLSVEEDLRPDEPPEALEGAQPETPTMVPPAPPPRDMKGEGSGNIEDQMIDKIGPGAP
jgi:hypothetical protein